MMPQIQSTAGDKTLSFPSAGIDMSAAFARQMPRQILGGSGGVQQQPVTGQPIVGGYDLNGQAAQPDPHMWASSTPSGTNVRGFDPQQNRRRGGSRCGLSRYIPAQADAEWLVQNLNYLVGTPGMQTNSSGRVVTLVSVVQGVPWYALAGDASWTATVNNTSPSAVPPLNLTGVVRSAVQNQILFFVDGVNWVLYSPLGGVINPTETIYGSGGYAVNSVNTWGVSTEDLLGNPITSVLPVDADGNLPTLIVNWRQRICVSGLLLSPQDIFMSAQGDPTNWDYLPTYTSVTQAVALDANSPSGQVGDVITCMIPYTDDILVIGGDHTIYLMNGDPMNGGVLSLVSDAIGMAFGIPWCKDPSGNIYFVSNRTGIYTLVPGQAPQRISQQIEQLIQNVDTGLNTITAIWDDRFQGAHFFFTPTQGPTSIAVTDSNVAQEPVTHLFYEARTGAWWQDQFANPNHNPLCCVTFDGNTPDDRVPLIGSWDGYVRAIDPFATDDDGWTIDSSVILGPILSPDMDDMQLHELQAVLGELSGSVNFAVYVGQTAEQALSSTPVASGSWGPGRNANDYIRRSGHAIYIEITATNAWSMEQVRCRIQGLGAVRRRRKY